MMAAALSLFQRPAVAAGCALAGLPDLARREDWRGRAALPALFSTLAGAAMPSDAIPGGRGGPKAWPPSSLFNSGRRWAVAPGFSGAGLPGGGVA